MPLASIKRLIGRLLLRLTPRLYCKIRNFRYRIMYWVWVKRGHWSYWCMHYRKVLTIQKYAAIYNAKIFVETGTYMGDMVYAVRNSFPRIYSAELDSTLHARAAYLFAKQENITILHGDSALLLPDILDRLDEPALFWLDGHFSGGITAKAELETPISEELRHILNHRVPNHVILIDDARLFNGERDYPALEALRDFIAGIRPDHFFEVDTDIIRITFGAEYRDHWNYLQNL